MAKSKEKVVGTPTANGIIKGRPGKGRVLSLEQRASCYHGHKMTEANTFRYTAKRVKGQPKPIERAWCKKCRADSRKNSATARRLREAKEAAAKKRETNAKLRLAMPKAKGSKGARKAKRAQSSKVATAKAAKPARKAASRKRAA